MYSNIVIPVSFEEGKDVANAIAVAQKLASPNAKITFIHITEIIPSYVADYIPTDAWEAQKMESQKQIKEIAKEVENAETVVVDGVAGRSITEWAADTGADLIVIASHRPQFSDIFLGSTAAWVVRHADCPVHVIR